MYAAITRRKRFVRKRLKASFSPKNFLAKVGDGKTILDYRKNDIVFSQGDVADAVFYIQQGNIKLTVVSEHGKEAVVAILGPGHFFGEGCLNGHPLRIATARAVDECVITRLEKATMIATVHREPEFSELFMSYLLTRNSRIEEDLIDQLFNSSEKRLARLLLLLANFGKSGRPEPIVGKFSQETLAEMDANSKIVPGALVAYDVTTVVNGRMKQLFHSDANPANSMGNFAKYSTPVVVNGKVYVGTFSNKVVQYDL
jgi:CRP/FNR family transcriptional regulator, cyclic AMP receptor protein